MVFQSLQFPLIYGIICIYNRLHLFSALKCISFFSGSFVPLLLEPRSVDIREVYMSSTTRPRTTRDVDSVTVIAKWVRRCGLPLALLAWTGVALLLLWL